MTLPPKLDFALLPTPIEPLRRLSSHLGGPEIWIKRDDLTGLAGGGNKARKLEYLLADALAAGARTVVTVGAPQSNHCRQTASAAARCGLRCVLVLHGEPPAKAVGNVLLDLLMGAEIVWTYGRQREAVMEEVCAREAEAGHAPYPIPLGGSHPLGVAGYVNAVQELAQQLAGHSDLAGGFTRICFASATGGTHAGLTIGARAVLPKTEVLGFSVLHPRLELQPIVARLAGETASLLELPSTFDPADIRANDGYIGVGYAIMGERERETIRLLAGLEGVLVDPVYTGKAFGGMLDLIRRGEIGKEERILFWHTGGQVALGAYAEQLVD